MGRTACEGGPSGSLVVIGVEWRDGPAHQPEDDCRGRHRRADPLPLRAQGSRASSSLDPYAAMRWGRGFEGQRRADLGNGLYLNPIFAGDHPDPSLLRDGEDYYVTFSSFDAYPGLVIWHSRDLVNWRPVTAALRTPIGSVWAPELVKHEGRYFLYIPARFPDRRSIWVIHAERIEGPWSEPIDLHLPDHIDPGHAVGEDGAALSLPLRRRPGEAAPRRPRHRSARRATSTIPGIIPRIGRSRGFSPEGPKIVRRGGYFYLVSAVGGHGGAADRPYGDHGAVALDPWPLGKRPAQSGDPHPLRAREMVVARPCHPVRRAGRALVA